MAKVLNYLKQKGEKRKTRKDERIKEKHRDEVYKKIRKEFDCFIPSECIDEADLILNCDNQEIIYQAFYQVKNDDFKKFILLNLHDKKYLENIVFDTSVKEKYRESAMIALDSQEVFEKVLLDKSNHYSFRSEAAKKLEGKDDKFWYDIIVTEENNYSDQWLLIACFSKIKSQQIIGAIVKKDNKLYLETLYKKVENGYQRNKIYKFEEIQKKLLAVELLADKEILKDLLFNYELANEIKIAIIKKLEKEEILMEAFRKYCDEEEITSQIVSRIEELGYTNSLLELVIESNEKDFVSRSIEKLTTEKELNMVVEKSKFWYAIAVAEKRLKELGF